jgi:hypothetical protein
VDGITVTKCQYTDSAPTANQRATSSTGAAAAARRGYRLSGR